ncbi:hypothetical protein MAH1_12310 [Sessilibacter sp. MAH1]
MKATNLTYSKSQAIDFLNTNKRKKVVYMYKFDVDVVFRKGQHEDQQIGKVRYKEDARPQKSYNKRTKREESKRNDVVTYKMPGQEDLYVLSKSGGVSLFDGISSKVSLSKKDCWWVITQNARLAEGLVIAKDIFKDLEGNTHYAIEPDRDMLLSDFIEKLEELKKYMKKLGQ